MVGTPHRVARTIDVSIMSLSLRRILPGKTT
jgi:hypothetical protein